MYRKAQESDLPGLNRLFVAAFGTDEKYAEWIYRRFAGLENTYVAVEDGEIAAGLCAVPVTLKGIRGSYYYALTTDEAYRGKGIMTALMEDVAKQLAGEGVRFITLIPASQSLFDFYAQRGFQKAFAKRKLQRTVRNNLWAVAEFDTVTANALEQLRKKFAPDSVNFKPEGWVCVLTDLYTGGLSTVASENGYGLYFKKNEQLEYIELFARTDRDAEDLLEAARQKESVENALINLGQCQTLFMGEGAVQDYGMIRFLGQEFDVQDCYMRLMLDDE